MMSKATILLTAVILGLAAAGLSWFRGYFHSGAQIRHELTDATVQHAKTSSVLPVSQNHSNGSNAYPKSSVSAPSLEAATDAYIEKIRRDPEYQWKMPINFFGKVVDQYDNPIAGAAVHFQWVNLRGSEGVEEADTMTDAEGRFSLQGKNGKNLGVSVSKDGYYHASPSENQLNFEYASR